MAEEAKTELRMTNGDTIRLSYSVQEFLDMIEERPDHALFSLFDADVKFVIVRLNAIATIRPLNDDLPERVRILIDQELERRGIDPNDIN